MSKNAVIDTVHEISEIETALTIFNAHRALSNQDKEIEVKHIGGCTLLIERHSPKSIYYNRVKGFGPESVKYIDDILEIYGTYGIEPCFDISPNSTCDIVSDVLVSRGYRPVESLVFMKRDRLKNQEILQLDAQSVIKEVCEDNAEAFIDLILKSNPHMSVTQTSIQKKKAYFYTSEFHNYIIYRAGQPAALGSLFIKGNTGYIANDFTFENMRGYGYQKVLLQHRIHIADTLGLDSLYTDVEFGHISHNNMKKMGFIDAYMSTYWVK